MWRHQTSQQIKERNLEVARQVGNRAMTDECGHRERNLGTVNMALVHLAKAVADGRVRMTMGNLGRLDHLETRTLDLKA